MQVLPDQDQLSTIIASAAGGVLVILGVVWRGFGILRRQSVADNTEAETLKLLQDAVMHWRSLYDTAWEQVKKERAMREAAEQRTTETMNEVEGLRAEVAELQRKIDHLTALVQRNRPMP